MNTLLNGPELLVGDVDLVEDQGPVGQQPVEQGVGHRLGLLVHLLAHVVVVAVLAGGLEVPVHGQPGRLDLGRRRGGGDPERSRPQLGDLVVLEHEELAGQPEDGRDVRGQEGGRVADPHEQRRDPAGGHDEVGLDRRGPRPPRRPPGSGPRATRTAPARPAAGSASSGASIRWARTSVSVSDSKRWPAGGQLVGQLDVVLDDPVVDEGHPARAVDMGVGVHLGRAPVGGPAGVADPGGGTLGCRPRPA